MKKIIIVFLLLNLFLSAQNISYKIASNGSFDIIGKSIKLTNCYPAINGISIRPIQIKTTASSIEYVLENGKLELIFSTEGKYLSLKTQTSLPQGIADIISPIHNCAIDGANRFYRTSGGIMGDGGIKKWNEKEVEKSTLLTGLLPDSGTALIVSTHDINKYVSYTDLKTIENKKSISVCIQTEKVLPTNLPTLYFSETEKYYEGMRAEAQEIGTTMKARTNKPQAYLWCSWYYSFDFLTEKMLFDYVKGFETIKPKIPLQTIQIDAGYHPHLGDWLEPSLKFPKGLEPSIKNIISKGYKAGIWIGPYMVGNRSKVFIEHPDWILKWGDNTQVRWFQFFDEQRLWGAMDEEYFTLDTSNPEVMAYLRGVFRKLRKMGITYFKTDFMMWGDQQSQNLKRHTPGKTSIEYQREFFKMIREEIGEESFWLGCIATYPSFIGYVDGMRVSADITAKWDGAESMFKETVGNQHINNVWWQNDPDAMILRTKFNKMTPMESKTINTWMGLQGGMICTSEDFSILDKDKIDFFRSFEPNSFKTTATFPFIDKQEDIEVLVKEIVSENTWIVYAINRNENKKSVDYTINSLVKKPKLFVSEYLEDKSVEFG
ncbi:MAG: alpha-galactosidase [Cytophagales bacterium]|nr:MAG: alpha-galactosidase [Cytophagales bacterium]